MNPRITLDSDISLLGLGKRVQSLLHDGAGVNTFGELLLKTEGELFDVNGLGDETLDRIIERLADLGWNLFDHEDIKGSREALAHAFGVNFDVPVEFIRFAWRQDRDTLKYIGARTLADMLDENRLLRADLRDKLTNEAQRIINTYISVLSD